MFRFKNTLSGVWSNQKFDIPIAINGFYKVRHSNIIYVSIEGSHCGIPITEIKEERIKKLIKKLHRKHCSDQYI